MALICTAVALTGCAWHTKNRAPVEDRGRVSRTPGAIDKDNKPPPGIENAGKPGYYTVQPGDTLMRISLETGQNLRDLVRWNNLENPNLIEVGQVLRVAAPNDNSSVVTRPVTASTVNASPVPAGTAASNPPATPTVPPASSAADESQVKWVWPAQGSLMASFDEAKNKGFDIGGKAGDAVVAAADGRVVYAGSGLRGYGNLIILKHNNIYLTAYAHNQTLLVKEDQTVKQGQKIAEMGNSDSDRVKLHFEIRRQGKPVDPAKYLPAK